jgi:hypothetical protein
MELQDPDVSGGTPFVAEFLRVDAAAEEAVFLCEGPSFVWARLQLGRLSEVPRLEVAHLRPGLKIECAVRENLVQEFKIVGFPLEAVGTIRVERATVVCKDDVRIPECLKMKTEVTLALTFSGRQGGPHSVSAAGPGGPLQVRVSTKPCGGIARDAPPHPVAALAGLQTGIAPTRRCPCWPSSSAGTGTPRWPSWPRATASSWTSRVRPGPAGGSPPFAPIPRAPSRRATSAPGAAWT